MGEIIRDWLRTRLGIIIDLSPEIFGHYARDGTLLAKVLHSYDVINDSQLSTLVQTQDPALARVNLKHLRVWLKFVGVDCDTDCIEDISNGKGTMSLRLFYKVFLCLENKDRLHFITLQKEREKYIPSSSKFDVTTISEEPETEQPEDHPYAEFMVKNLNLVDWQRKKYRDLIDSTAKERNKFRSLPEVKANDSAATSGDEEKKISIERKRVKSRMQEAAMRELDEFARKHRVKSSKEPPDPCEDISPKTGSARTPKPPKIDHEAAKAYTKLLKMKHRREALTKSFKTRMQKNLLNELWEKVLDDQEMEFDEIVAKKVLHQSQYEKQLVRKMCEVRSEKTRMAENRAIVEDLFEKKREDEMRLEQERAREVLERESEEVEAERRRICELERRIEEQSKRRRNEKHRRFCERVVHDLVDVSTKAAEYKIKSNEDRVPSSMWNGWKALFFKGQPIIEAEDRGITEENVEDDVASEEYEEDDYTRTEVLNNEDFENYHNTKLQWKDFMPSVDDEVRHYLKLGILVLGYIVHKTMESLYPRNETEFVESPLPALKTRALLVGLPDSLLYEPIQNLLKNSKVHLVRIEDAINHCLWRYKAEMKDYEYVDLDVAKGTREDMNSASISSATEEREKKIERINKSASSKPRTARSLEQTNVSKNGVDKVTQTPRVIPHDDLDPSLSDAAYIGKWIHEFFTVGEPLSDDLISRTILQYLRSLQDIKGFVVVDYPNNHRQMNSLESVLSGRRLRDNPNGLSSRKERTNIDEIDAIPSRISFDEGGEETTSGNRWRRSRLVPNPIELRYADENSYFTAFVRIKAKSRDSEESKADDDIWEVLGDDATSVDVFYVDQEIASILYYTIFDVGTMKELVRLLLADKDELIAKTPSEELFGDYIEYFEGRGDDEYAASKAPVVKKLLRPGTSDDSFGESKFSVSVSSGLGGDDAGSLTMKEKDGPVLPGEAEWSWANLPQPHYFLQSLATLWQTLETSYIENLKDIFHLKRLNFDAILPYRDFVARHMKEMIDRPDKKQDLLHEFHRAFNDIDEDIRDDLEVKKELHCRIEEFQAKLWEVCDSRRRETEDERRRIIMDHWTTRELINIVNVYIDILQVEIDRCNDTLQFIQDYYTSMLQRLHRPVRTKVTLKKIVLDNRASDFGQDSSGVNGSVKSAKEKESRETRGKISVSKIPQVPVAPGENLFKEEMAKILIEVDRENCSPTQTLAYRTTEANIQYIQSILETLASRILEDLKEEETNTSRLSSEPKDKRGSSRKVSRSNKPEQDIEKKRIREVILEWRYALMFEINRLRVRLKILHSAAKSDITYLIDTMRRVFSMIQDNTIERYERETKSVDEMASTFRFAVEEAKPIQEEMLLDGDRFLVRSNVLMFPDKPEAPTSPVREKHLPSRFTVKQLASLYDLFDRVAPGGIMSERAFVYILQDLIVCEDEKGDNSLLPASWFELRACDVTRLVYELFGNAEFVDWREFIIYAMDVEMPGVGQILENWRAFRKIDDECTECLDCDKFFSVRLCFLDNQDEASSSLPVGFNPDVETIQGKDGSGVGKTMENNLYGEPNDTKLENILRSMLMKKLLFSMFSPDDSRVNYVALLLAFCKDEKPEVGLGKALSLAIGNEICMDWDKGEEYAKKRLEDEREEPRATRSSEVDLRAEAKKISEAILNRLLRRVVETSESRLKDTPEEEEEAEEEELEENIFPTVDNNSSLDRSENATRTATPEERRSRGLSVTISLPDETRAKRFRTKTIETIYWINFEVSQSVLATALPCLAVQPDVFQTGKSLYENLKLVYAELDDEKTKDESNSLILAHRFLRHDFTKRLLAETTKFKTKYLGNIIEDIIRDNR